MKRGVLCVCVCVCDERLAESKTAAEGGMMAAFGEEMAAVSVE